MPISSTKLGKQVTTCLASKLSKCFGYFVEIASLCGLSILAFGILAHYEVVKLRSWQYPKVLDFPSSSLDPVNHSLGKGGTTLSAKRTEMTIMESQHILGGHSFLHSISHSYHINLVSLPTTTVALLPVGIWCSAIISLSTSANLLSLKQSNKDT